MAQYYGKLFSTIENENQTKNLKVQVLSPAKNQAIYYQNIKRVSCLIQLLPRVKKIIAGYNPWEADREAAGVLGLNWNNIGHIAAGFI